MNTLIWMIGNFFLFLHVRFRGKNTRLCEKKTIKKKQSWQIARYPNGTIEADPTKFPSGIPALVDFVHSLGLKFGLYSDAGNKTWLAFVFYLFSKKKKTEKTIPKSKKT